MIGVLIADDEKPARDELRFLLESVPDVTVVAEAANGDEALRLIAEHKPDVVFLDVEMPGKNGLEVAAELKGQSGGPKVIFATAYEEYAVRAFEVAAVDYILKPFDGKRVAEAVEKLSQSLDSCARFAERIDRLFEEISEKFRTKKIPAEKNGCTVLLDSSELIYVSSIHGKVMLKTFDKEYGCRLSLLEIESRLGSGFLRVHRSFIVNLDKISEIIPWFSGTYNIVVKDRERSRIPVSRSQVRQLKHVLGI
ncbi:MAG TPA: response regulator transcription factor [Firmicutes bacterium]|nr:response regulator transcription factor [Bacillota bacterium]